MAWLFELLRSLFGRYGYWTIGGALMLENAGLPVPGETVLLFASFLAYSEGQLRLRYLVLIGVVACTLGDNIGYWLGKHGGRRLLERHQRFFHLRQQTMEEGEQLFRRYGAVAIFFARFIFGMRIMAGPMAGVLRMEWRRFLLFNFLGAAVWVTTVALVGYGFGSQWDELAVFFKRADFVVFIAAVLAVLLLWRWHRRRRGKSG